MNIGVGWKFKKRESHGLIVLIRFPSAGGCVVIAALAEETMKRVYIVATRPRDKREIVGQIAYKGGVILFSFCGFGQCKIGYLAWLRTTKIFKIRILNDRLQTSGLD